MPCARVLNRFGGAGQKCAANPGLSWTPDSCVCRKTGTATNSRLWNWLAVPGLPTADTPPVARPTPSVVSPAKRGLPPIPAFGIGWLYPVSLRPILRQSRALPRLSCPPQNGDCHQFPPLELVGCTRFAYG